MNPGPSGEDAEVSANLAMSDHLCAKAHGSADIRAQRSPSPSLADLSSFGATVAQFRGGASWLSTTSALKFEAQVIDLIRLFNMTSPELKTVDSSTKSFGGVSVRQE